MLEHVQQSRVAFEELAGTADSRDPDRRPLINRAMINFASEQSLRRLRAMNELSDLDARDRQHRHEVVLDVPDFATEELDDSDGRSAADNREGDRGAQSGAALRAGLLVVVRRQVVQCGRDPRLPYAADQSAARLDGEISRRVVELPNIGIVATPRVAQVQAVLLHVDAPVLRDVPIEVRAKAAEHRSRSLVPAVGGDDHLPNRDQCVAHRIEPLARRDVGHLDEQHRLSRLVAERRDR